MGGLWAVLAGTAATVCTAIEQCAVCEPCKGFICRVLRQVVDSTAGDVVQLVRTLPCRWLESYTVTAEAVLSPINRSTNHHKLRSPSEASRQMTSSFQLDAQMVSPRSCCA